jgi:hypothetical protein
MSKKVSNKISAKSKKRIPKDALTNNIDVTVKKKNNTNCNIKKAAMIKALKSNLGNVSKSCDEVGIERSTHYRWFEDDAEYKKTIHDIEEANIDFAECKLRELMEGANFQAVTNKGAIVTLKSAPNPTSVNFFLKTKGRSRGYAEKLEIDHNVNNLESVQFIIKGKDK